VGWAAQLALRLPDYLVALAVPVEPIRVEAGRIKTKIKVA
jgi:hypothetical protein